MSDDTCTQDGSPDEIEIGGSIDPCSYLPGQSARMTYRIAEQLSEQRYQQLLERGWRRFGKVLFRPNCPVCSACTGIRVPISTFYPSKSQRRCLKTFADITNLTLTVSNPTLSREHIQLHNNYHQDMHHRKQWPFRKITSREYAEAFLDGQFPFSREFQYRHKKPERIHAKMMSKGYEASQIHDVLAGIFKCRNKNFANEVAKYLFNVYRDQIINFERKMEGMGKGNDRTGYQDYSEAFHINLNLNGLGVEIQVMTKKAAQLKDIAHDQYKRVRVGGELDPEMARLTALGFRQPESQKTGRKPVPRFDPKGKLAGGRQRDYSFRDYVQQRDND